MKWVQLCGSLNILWHCSSLGLESKHIFQSYGHCWVFQICWHTECSTLTASSFRIWNNSVGVPSTPLALLIVMLSKAKLSSHSKMSGSQWVITPSWFSGSLRSFLYSSPVHSCHLFLDSPGREILCSCHYSHEWLQDTEGQNSGLEKESGWGGERNTGRGEWAEIGMELELMIVQSLSATQGSSAIIFPLQLGQLRGESQNSSKLFLEPPFPL